MIITAGAIMGEIMASKELRQKNTVQLLRLVIVMVLITLIGCTTTLTHQNTNYPKISRDEAVRKISELSLVYPVVSPGFVNSLAFAKIDKVDSKGFSFIRGGPFVRDLGCTPAIVGGRSGTLCTRTTETESLNIRVDFDDITGVQIDYFEITGEGPQIQLLWKRAPPFLLLTPHGLAAPAKPEEYAAAFLTLCPSIP